MSQAVSAARVASYSVDGYPSKNHATVSAVNGAVHHAPWTCPSHNDGPTTRVQISGTSGQGQVDGVQSLKLPRPILPARYRARRNRKVRGRRHPYRGIATRTKRKDAQIAEQRAELHAKLSAMLYGIAANPNTTATDSGTDEMPAKVAECREIKN